MAEDTDNTQKPKAELIKKPQHDHDEGGGKSSADHGERRKVIVVKKKPPAISIPPKKIQPKVVVTSHTESPAPAPQTQKAEDTASQTASAPVSTPAEDQPKLKKEKPAASPEVKSPPVNQGTDRPENKVTSFQITQRPAAAAGRVGGKPVGRRDDHFRQPSQYTPRSGGAQAGRGGNNRPPHTDQGGGRPPFRPGGGFTPRPGGGGGGRPGF
ncbi:MAG TPA: hypothetical protein DEQ14_08395, partial [Treponema sp.]|nr:hypothetical protein [Treponema sp.]